MGGETACSVLAQTKYKWYLLWIWRRSHERGWVQLDCRWRKEAGWPEHHKVIIVDRFCGEAVLRGANIYKTGVLCADAGVYSGDPIAVYADLHGQTNSTVTRGMLLQRYVGRRCVFVGVGVAECTRTSMFRPAAAGVAVSMRQTVAAAPKPPMNDILSNNSTMVLQNLPSVAVAHALDPVPGDCILDMCAAQLVRPGAADAVLVLGEIGEMGEIAEGPDDLHLFFRRQCRKNQSTTNI